MTREEQISNESLEYMMASCIHDEIYDVDVRNAFEEGAKWADSHSKHTWINVKDDLPCNHKDFVFGTPFGTVTKEVLVLTARGYYIAYMHFKKGWHWSINRKVSHWMEIPKLVEE